MEATDVIFTNHAMQRVKERFGSIAKPIPWKKLKSTMGLAAKGEKYRARFDGVTYGLSHDGSRVFVLTVYPTNKRKDRFYRKG